jgi:Na+/phosphate symporter
MPVSINLSKFKELWKEKLREQRKSILSDLDVEYIRALETNDTNKQEQIVQRKNQLRNITKLVDDATSVEEIKSIVIS